MKTIQLFDEVNFRFLSALIVHFKRELFLKILSTLCT